MKSLKSITALVSLFAAIFPAQSQAQTANVEVSYSPSALLKRGVYLDANTGLVWARCLVGQQWSGGKCSGEPKSFNGLTAASLIKNNNHEFAGFSGWQVPTISELTTLRRCKLSGQTSFIPSAKGGHVAVPSACEANNGPAIDPAIFYVHPPKGMVGVDASYTLVSHSFKDESDGSWYLDVDDGSIHAHEPTEQNGYVRLVLRRK